MEVLQIDGITKQMGGVQVLQDVSLTVRAGQRRAIIGPNGAGKTTLFRIIAGELQPSAGRIRLYGEDITHLPAHQRARRGLVRTFQHTAVFFELTVLENVMLAVLQGRHALLGMTRLIRHDRYALDEVEKILQDWRLEEYARAEVRYLPYGLQRRLELAMAFARRPRVLLLDEPTAGLASDDVEEIGERLCRISRDVTVVFIDHNMKTVFAVADRITVLHHGRLLAEGTPEDIRRNPIIQDAYLGAVRKQHVETI